MQAEIHLIRYIAEVSAASCCATIVHLKTFDDAIRIDLNRFRILSANIQNGRRFRVHYVRPKPMAKNFGADMFLRKRQGRPAIAGTNNVGLFQLGPVRKQRLPVDVLIILPTRSRP